MTLKVLEVTVKMTVPVMVEDTASHDELTDLLKYELEGTLKATIHELKLHAIAPGDETEVEPSAEPTQTVAFPTLNEVPEDEHED